MAVQFDEGPVMATRSSVRRTSFITNLVLKTGLVKTERGAKIVLLGVLVLALLLTTLFVQRTNIEVEPPSPDEYLVN
jgi:hypothetical protein